MHEMSLCQGVLDTLIEVAYQQHFQKVKTLQVTVGKLVAVEKSLFQFSFDILSKGTLAENAELDIVTIDGRGYCSDCQQEVAMDSLYCACPICGNWGLKIVQGKELKVTKLEVA